MHFCWRSLDDKSLSSLLESCTKKCISYACLYNYIVNTIWLKVYGYDYGMICFDTRFWYFTEDEENIFQHSKYKRYVLKVWLYSVYWRQEPKIIPHRISLKAVLAIVHAVLRLHTYIIVHPSGKFVSWHLIINIVCCFF